MTTITIEDKLPKTRFANSQELFSYLRDYLNPVKIFLVDEASIPKNINDNIEKAAKEKGDDIVDFKG